eukprot:CAMPEP_0171102114 /NCGR_PEP_ID=MMETSP0766_2-20121228/56869_1 /TAXON_ID=439317 /ORGANISM="Gambierdiscus australes, Strain CAWD 149" /LENGTH=96 /DNA_ID=CAMNT_0011562323 /DNA_START=54 /DNA_END=345 /DNA_ORIENTATION=+
MKHPTTRTFLACLAVATLRFAWHNAPAPRASPFIPVAMAGSLAALPALAQGPEALDAQLLLARITGGKFTREKQLVVSRAAGRATSRPWRFIEMGC